LPSSSDPNAKLVDVGATAVLIPETVRRVSWRERTTALGALVPEMARSESAPAAVCAATAGATPASTAAAASTTAVEVDAARARG